MPNTPTDTTSQGRGEILRAWLNNLGITAFPSLGEGELMVALANASATQNAQGNTDLAPANAITASLARSGVSSQTLALATGTLGLTAVYLTKGQTVNNLNVLTGSTAGAGLTHQWAALYNSALLLVAVSADGTSAAIAANTVLSYPIANVAAGAATSYIIPTSGIYYIGILVTNGTTQPTFAGSTSGNAASNAIVPILSGTSNTGLTTPPTFPTTATAITATAGVLYVYVT